MKTWQFAVLAGLVFVVALFAALPVLAPDRTYPSWEYKIVSIPDEKFETEMNNWGYGRWELVFARRAMTGEGTERTGIYEVIFKRPM